MGSNVVRRVTGRNGDDGDDDDGDRPSVDRRLVSASRRDPLSVSLQRHAEAGLVSEVLPVRDHRGHFVVIRSQVSVGIDQRICLAWDVPAHYFLQGYRLLGFRRTDGFAPEEQRNDLAAHGAKIIDARASDVKEELLAEGEYFYTFLLYRKVLLGCFHDTVELVQFSERIPSAKHAIGRLEDTLRARELEQKLLRMAKMISEEGADHEKRFGSGVDFAKVLAEQNRDIEAAKAAPEWKKLKPAQRTFILGQIRQRYRRKMGQEE